MSRTAVAAVALCSVACGEAAGTLAPATPSIAVAPLRLEFGDVPVGQAKGDELVVANHGRAPLFIDAVRIEGPDAESFRLVGPSSAELASNRSEEVALEFRPTTVGPLSASAVLYHNVPGVAPVSVPLSGEGTRTSTMTTCVDGDRDGYGDGCARGPDCDDVDADVHPGAVEVCNGLDDDCSGRPDDGLETAAYWPDGDGDGHGAVGAPMMVACAPPAGHVSRAGDCDDSKPGVHPGAAEVCTGGLDEDCNGLTDAADPACAAPPMTCQAQDPCGPNLNRQVCPLDGRAAPVCEALCRTDAECPGGACRPLPGSTSLGYCGVAGRVPAGGACSVASDCAVGICLLGACRPLCQSRTDCMTGEDCGVALYDTRELGGGGQRRMTTACRPPDARRETGTSCLLGPTNLDSGVCNTGHCDFLPWAAQLTSGAACAPLCAGAGDCGPGQVCGLVYNGFAESPQLASTGEASGRYFEAMLGCYTPVFAGSSVPPGTGQLGAFCDSTRANGRLTCRSHQCAQFAPIQNQCTDFCDSDADCVTPSTPTWRCRVGELSLTGIFLQEAGIADITKFTLVGVCAP